jgi:RNA polymerase sigma-70 factor (ECF subfamily)
MRGPQMSDEMTVVLAREGNRDAFRRLYENHREQVYRTAYRYSRSAEDAEDIMQETFIKAFSRIRTFDFRASSGFSAWIVSICINAAIDHLRRRERREEKKRISLSDLPQEIPAGNPSPEDVEIRRQALERIRESLRILSPRQRVVFDLRYDRHMDIKDIAGRLGCSESNVKTQLGRSLEKLRRTLEPRWRRS